MGLRESDCHNVSSSLMITPRQIRPELSVSNAESDAALCFQTINLQPSKTRESLSQILDSLDCKDHDHQVTVSTVNIDSKRSF